MLNLLYDFIPVILFFVSFKWFGIYVATVVGIVSTAAQVVITTVVKKRIDKKQLITLIIFSVFGGMTLYFHNPLFIKWKPTVIYWIFAVVLFFSHFVGNKTIMQRLMEGALDNNALFTTTIWHRLNLAWALFFTALGCLNLFIAYHFSTNTWVNFKLYGTLGLLLLFSFLQAAYLSKFMPEKK